MKPENTNRNQQSIELVNGLFMINVFLKRTGNSLLAQYGLNQSQFTVLTEITQRKNLSQKDILGTFLLEKSNLSKIIKKLEQMNLVETTQSETDKRKFFLNATPQGRALQETCMHALDRLKVQFTEPLQEEELDQLHHAVKKLEELVSQHTQNPKKP